MSNQSWPGVSSLVLNEPLLWEKGRPGRVGVSLPESDVPAAPYEAEGMVRTDLNLPDLAELDVVRHYTRLSGRPASDRCARKKSRATRAFAAPRRWVFRLR